MAVCIVMEFAGMNARQYEALMDVLELRGVNPAWPEGIISHVVGFTDQARMSWMFGNLGRSSMLF